jgi:hypothetical protein
VSRAAFYNRAMFTRESLPVIRIRRDGSTFPGMAGQISPFFSQCVTIADNSFQGEFSSLL